MASHLRRQNLIFLWMMRLRRAGYWLRAQSHRRSNVTIGRSARFHPGVLISAEPGSTIVIGDNVELGAGTRIVSLHQGELVIESGVTLAHGVTVAAYNQVRIGSGVMIAEYTSVRDHDHDPAFPPNDSRMLVGAVSIGADSWIANKVTVCRGASVGANSVIGANSVVTHAVPDGVLAVGAPARVIRPLRAAADSVGPRTQAD
jgi:acetyltransferase-like isoleucine patch superfamily enzyme